MNKLYYILLIIIPMAFGFSIKSEFYLNTLQKETKKRYKINIDSIEREYYLYITDNLPLIHI